MIRIKIVSDLDKKGLEEAQRGLDKLKGIADGAFRVVAAGAGIAAIGIGKFAADSIRAASDLEESTNAVNVAFGKSAKAVLEVGANSAESLGLARNEFNAAAVRFSAFAERIVGSGGDASKFIAEVSQRASDFASVFNIEVSEALQVFQSGLAGEAEPLKRFGINLLQSEVQAFALANGIGEVGREMTETEKVQARYGLLLESTAKTAGDFANTSEGLANSQRILKAQFTDLQAEIGSALLPAFTDLFKAVADQVMPELQKLGEFLKSPEGQKAIADFAETVGNLTTKLIENFDSIIKTAGSIAIFVTSVKLVTTAVGLATTAQLLFNTAVKLNPYVLAATGLLAFVAAVTTFRNDADKAALSAQKQSYQVDILATEIDNLNASYNSGAIDIQTYENSLRVLEQELNSVKISTEGTAGEINRMNSLRLDGAIKSMNEFKNATSLAERQAKTFNDSYSYLESIGAVTRRVAQPVTTSTSSSTGSGPSAFQVAKERAEDLIKSSQKQIANAQKTYNSTIQNANKNYADSVLRLQGEFASRLDNIIQSSQSRLRDAYRSAVETNIAGLFDQQEEKSVAGLVKSLSDKLTASRTLLSNSAQLASQGFSQTFIEQIVSAGTETGNELASAILQSTPEARGELKSLFGAIEIEASQGMDSLATEIFNKQGLATQEMKNLYAATQVELTDALLAQQETLDLALLDANETLLDALAAIREAMTEQILDLDGQFGGLGKSVDSLVGKLDGLIGKYAEVKLAADASAVIPVSVPMTPSNLPKSTPTTKAAVTPSTQVTVNVKTDSTQSQAQVGKQIAQAINRYTGGGGNIRVSKVFAI